MPRGWFGEPGRHALARRGIKTGRKAVRRPLNVQKQAREWAYDWIYEVEPDYVGEKTKIIDGREYLLTFEPWSLACFIPFGPETGEKFHEGSELVYKRHAPRKENEERCIQFMTKISKRLLEEDWPRRWNEYRMIEGKFDTNAGELGMTWALWVRK
jgi:hypothetical protein